MSPNFELNSSFNKIYIDSDYLMALNDENDKNDIPSELIEQIKKEHA